MKQMYLTLLVGGLISTSCLANTDTSALFEAIKAKNSQLVSAYLSAETVNKTNPQGDDLLQPDWTLH
ncbi:hypothetical protein [Vibrio sp. SCSIO 43137]|uniref:hypothetical protein n=1 Tax=Vibrio sp. SCSIO 43137 TaxID=3021011 RepID=UPI0023082F53|nr:hypothetical protein [Vibrio sp. SCSIO 43137]WCE31438.1 hypothetical protein PK654_20095 [Vibrio sp. SCSIO 43137]